MSVQVCEVPYRKHTGHVGGLEEFLYYLIDFLCYVCSGSLDKREHVRHSNCSNIQET
jgi:hypothetical protein